MPECSLCGKDVGSAESLSPVTSGETTVNDACAECRKAVAEDPVAEARRLLAERTPGEWSVERIQREGQDDHAIVWSHFPRGRTIVAEGIYLADGILIAAAPLLLAALCERLEAAERCDYTWDCGDSHGDHHCTVPRSQHTPGMHP